MADIVIVGMVVSLIAVMVAGRVNIPITSSYYLFISFSLLYCAYMYIGSNIETGGLSLLEDKELVNYVILNALTGLLFFVIFYKQSSTYKRKLVNRLVENKTNYTLSPPLFLPVYLALLFVLVFFSKSYGWHAVSREGVEGAEASLFAYGKYFYVCMALAALWCNPLSKKWIMFILLTQVALMFFDGGRTTFFGLIVAYAWILSKNGINLKLYQVGYLILFALLLLASRALVLGEGLIDGMVSSLVAEGIFAGYTGLQMADYVRRGGDFLYGITYLFDPIIYLLPKGTRENYLFFFTSSVANYSGQESFGPLGGFFWIAEAITNFGIFGGAIVGSMYGYLLAKLEFGHNGNDFYRMSIIAALGCLLAKYYLANGVKIAIFYLGAAFIIKIVFLKRRYAARPAKVNQSTDTHL